MAHLSADRLAALASDPSERPGPGESEHLAGCRACREDVAELGVLAQDVRSVRDTDLRPPHPDVWATITRELGTRAVATVRPGRLGLAVAAAVGLVVGAGATLGVLALERAANPDPPVSVVSRTDLAALRGESGQGTAELVREHDTLQLRVHAALQASPGADYHEVWLINGDGQRMYALGVLPSSGDASFFLPTPLGAQLDGYATVDISLEPDDGDAAHSQHSLVRGRLPG